MRFMFSVWKPFVDGIKLSKVLAKSYCNKKFLHIDNKGSIANKASFQKDDLLLYLQHHFHLGPVMRLSK